MRVLLVGANDVVGRGIALRLYKEGHIVTRLAEDSENYLFNEEIKGKVYEADLENNRCKSVFKANSIDTVIFTSSQYREQYLNNDNNLSYLLPKLENILKISVDCHVKQFVFLSSTELNNQELKNKYLVELLAAENLVDLYSSTDMICNNVRVSVAYDSTFYYCNGFINQVLSAMSKKELIQLEFDKESSLNLIMASDAADAIYRILNNMKCGLFNIYSKDNIKVKDLLALLAIKTDYNQKIIYGDKHYEIINMGESVEDKCREELGWITIYSFDEHGDRIIDATIELNKKYVVDKREQVRDKKAFKMIRATLENLLLFVFTIWIVNNMQLYTDLRYIDVRLVYVVIIATIYGGTQSIIAIILACISHLYMNISKGIDITYLFYSVESWTPLVMYIITGACVGYMFDKKNDQIDNLTSDSVILNKKYEFLKSIYKDVCDIKNQLQKQITVSKDSFGKVYEITKQLDTFKPELIFFKTIAIIEDIMECNSVCIYIINSNTRYARLIAYSSQMVGKVSSTLNLENLELINNSINEQTMFVNKGLDEKYPDYVMPVVYEDEVVAIITIVHLDFDKFTLYYQNLFQIICGLVQSNLIKAYQYTQKGVQARYYDGTEIYKPAEFREQLNDLHAAAQDINVTYICAKITNVDNKIVVPLEFNNKIRALLRTIDIVGCDEAGYYYVVFMQTKSDNFELLKSRFSKADLEIEVER